MREHRRIVTEARTTARRRTDRVNEEAEQVGPRRGTAERVAVGAAGAATRTYDNFESAEVVWLVARGRVVRRFFKFN